MGGALQEFDVKLLALARTRGHTRARDRSIARFSRLGEYGAVWFAIGLTGRALDHENRAQWSAATRLLACVYALNTTLKLLVRRQRPQLSGLGALTDVPTQLSFPSAHASTSFAGALAFRRLGAPGAPLQALAVSLALSRLYLGVHYPSDVLAGALLGAGAASIWAPSPA